MGAFTTKKKIFGDSSMIPYMAEQIRQEFSVEGFEVIISDLKSGKEINITKGGLFKAVVGLRSALKVSITPAKDGYIDFEAGVSIVKQQLLPTIVTVWLFVWLFSPVVIVQIWGMIKQSKLDEKALDIAEKVAYTFRQA